MRARTDFFTCRSVGEKKHQTVWALPDNVSPPMKRWNLMLPTIFFFAQPLTHITTRALLLWTMFALKERIFGLSSRQIHGWNLTILLHAGPPRFHISQSIGRIRATLAWQIRNSPPHPTNNLKSAGPGSMGGSVLTAAQHIRSKQLCLPNLPKTFEKVQFRCFTVNGMHLTKSCKCQEFRATYHGFHLFICY